MVISFVIDLINDSISNFINSKIQKELSIGVLRKSCPENMQQSYMRTPIPKCDFSKGTFQLC